MDKTSGISRRQWANRCVCCVTRDWVRCFNVPCVSLRRTVGWSYLGEQSALEWWEHHSLLQKSWIRSSHMGTSVFILLVLYHSLCGWHTVNVTQAAGGAINQEHAQETEACMSLCCGDGYVMDIWPLDVGEGEYISLFIDTRVYD